MSTAPVTAGPSARTRPTAGSPHRARRAAAALVLFLLVSACSGGSYSDNGGAAGAGSTDRADSSGGADRTGASDGGTPAPEDGSSPSAEPTAPVDPDAPTGWGPTEGEVAGARALVEAMSLRQQVATVLMPGFWGYDGTDPTSTEAQLNRVMHGADSAADVLATDALGGVFLRPEVIADADQISRLTASLHESGDLPASGAGRSLPLLVAIDQEGGVVQRLKVGVDVVPSAASVGDTGDPSYAKKVARANGRTLRDLGVTMVLAPVADVDPDGSSVIGTRAYSSDTGVAAEMVSATVEGYLAAGVLPAVKHFPGLGTVTGDSHRSLPQQGKSIKQLRKTDLAPFETAIKAGAPVIMTGHVSVDAIEPGMPASISAGVTQGLLRDTLGFEGVAITDSQGMGPINGTYNTREGAIRSLLAGNDLVLNSPYPARARRAVADAVRTGRLPAARLTEAATRVIALRAYQARIAEGASAR